MEDIQILHIGTAGLPVQEAAGNHMNADGFRAAKTRRPGESADLPLLP